MHTYACIAYICYISFQTKQFIKLHSICFTSKKSFEKLSAYSIGRSIKLYLIVDSPYLYMMFLDSPWSMSQDLVDLIESSQLRFHGGIFIVDNLRLQFGLMNIQKFHARMSSHCLEEKMEEGKIHLLITFQSRWIDPRKFVLIFG